MQPKKVSESEVLAAIQRFRKEGGLIRRLPDEIVPRRMVSVRHHSYETLENLLSKLEPAT